MTVKENTFEGQASGTTLSAANSGGGSGDAFDTVNLVSSTAIFSNAQAMHGTLSLLYSATTSQDVDIRATSFTANQVVAVRAYFRWASVAPSANVFPIGFRTAGGTRIAQIVVQANGRLSAAIGTSSTVITATATSSSNITANTWYRVEAIVTVNASVQAQSRLQYAFYPGDSATPVFSYDSGATLDMGTTAAIGQVRFGKNISTSTWTGNHHMDTVAWEEGRTTFIGVYNPGAPAPADLVYPITLIDNTDTWTNEGGAASIIAALSDSFTSTYVQSPALGVAVVDFEVLLGPLNDDAGRSAWIVITASVSAVAVGATAVVYVYEGATLRATLPFTPTTSIGQHILTMTSGETASITDWSNVRLRFSYEP